MRRVTGRRSRSAQDAAQPPVQPWILVASAERRAHPHPCARCKADTATCTFTCRGGGASPFVISSVAGERTASAARSNDAPGRLRFRSPLRAPQLSRSHTAVPAKLPAQPYLGVDIGPCDPAATGGRAIAEARLEGHNPPFTTRAAGLAGAPAPVPLKRPHRPRRLTPAAFGDLFRVHRGYPPGGRAARIARSLSGLAAPERSVRMERPQAGSGRRERGREDANWNDRSRAHGRQHGAAADARRARVRRLRPVAGSRSCSRMRGRRGSGIAGGLRRPPHEAADRLAHGARGCRR